MNLSVPLRLRISPLNVVCLSENDENSFNAETLRHKGAEESTQRHKDTKILNRF